MAHQKEKSIGQKITGIRSGNSKKSESRSVAKSRKVGPRMKWVWEILGWAAFAGIMAVNVAFIVLGIMGYDIEVIRL